MKHKEGYISVIIRNQHLVAIVWSKDTIIYMLKMHLLSYRETYSLQTLIQLIYDYNIQTMIIEPNFKYKKQLHRLSLRLVEISLVEAKISILQRKQATHQMLAEYIVNEYPQLERYLSIDQYTNAPVLISWRHTVIILCTALGHTVINQ